jgi:Probable zinc-ribbon domain
LSGHGLTYPAADLARQAPNNSYSPPLYYVDRSFTCISCGSQEVWTAEQQQWYYEVAKGPIYAGAIRCRECRKAHRAMQENPRVAPQPRKGDQSDNSAESSAK